MCKKVRNAGFGYFLPSRQALNLIPFCLFLEQVCKLSYKFY